MAIGQHASGNMALTATQIQALTNMGNLTYAGSTSNIGLQGPGGRNILNEIRLSSSNQHDSLKRYEVCESTEDIVTLGTTAYRIMRDNSVHYKLTERDLYSKITSDDRELSEQIKNYYSKKVMMWNLKGDGKLSSFRKDMNTLIHSDGLVFKESMIGIAYWLPYFHEYDLRMDKIKIQVNKDQDYNSLDKKNVPRSLNITEKLIPLDRIVRRSKHGKMIEYWLKSNNELEAAIQIKLEDKNPLQHIWDKIFDKKEELSIEGMYNRRKLDDLEYFSVTKWQLV
jgi:hypothetical protein